MTTMSIKRLSSTLELENIERVPTVNVVYGMLNNVLKMSNIEKDEKIDFHCEILSYNMNVDLHCCVCFAIATNAMHSQCCTICICRQCNESLFPPDTRVPCPLCRHENTCDDYIPDYRTSRVALTIKKCGFCRFEGNATSLNEHVTSMRCVGLRKFCWQLMTIEDVANVPLPEEEVLLHGATLACCVRAAGTPFLSLLSPRVLSTLDEDFFRSVCMVPFILRFAGESLRSKDSFIDFMVTAGKNASAVKYASDHLRRNQAFARKIISEHWQSFRYFHAEALNEDNCMNAMQLSNGKVFPFVPLLVRNSYRFQEFLFTTLNTTHIRPMFDVNELFETQTHLPDYLLEKSNVDLALQLLDDTGMGCVWRYMYWYLCRVTKVVDSEKVDFERVDRMLKSFETQRDFCVLFLEKNPKVTSPEGFNFLSEEELFEFSME